MAFKIGDGCRRDRDGGRVFLFMDFSGREFSHGASNSGILAVQGSGIRWRARIPVYVRLGGAEFHPVAARCRKRGYLRIDRRGLGVYYLFGFPEGHGGRGIFQRRFA